MIDPNRQGQLILSFVEERHAARLRQQERDAGRSPWVGRVMFGTGKLLIAAGAGLQALGQLDSARPAIAASPMEAH